MKNIALTKGKVTIVDDEDFEYLNQWKWQAVEKRNTGNFYIGLPEGSYTGRKMEKFFDYESKGFWWK